MPLPRPPHSTKWTSLLLVSVAFGAAACGTSSETSTGPSPVKCQVALSLPQSPIAAGGGAGTLSVTTSSECAWTASEEVSWITGLNPASGQGQGQIQFQVAPNPNSTSRLGDITLNGVTARVSQMGASCTISLTPSSQSIAAGGAAGSVTVGAPAGCAWAATSDDAWVTITSGTSGSGAGTVNFAIGANTGATRVGGIAIGGQTFVITQASPATPSPSPSPTPSCSFAIQTAAASVVSAGGTATVTVQAPAGCAWTAVSNVSWLGIVGAAAGNGNGSVTISAAANTGSARTGTITVAGQTFTVNQAGSCTASMNSSSQSISAAGGSGTAISVTAPVSCNWTTTSNDSWLTITAGASGTGNGQVRFSAAANPGPARTGTLTIAGLTFTVDQAAGSCTSSITPASQTVGATGGAGTPIGVTSPPGCGWTANSAAQWITITAGASGSGNGTVAFTAAANTGAARTGTITIAGQTHTVTQSAPCTYSISAVSQNLNKNAQKGKDIDVSAAAGCAWTAVSNDSWITITSNASDSGDGTVKWTVSQNTGNGPRTGTMTIAGQTFTVTQSN